MTKSFQVNVIVRIVLLVLLSLYTGWVYSSGQPVYNTIALVVLIIILAASFIWYVNQINRKITYFFDAVINEDYTLSFPQHQGDRLLNMLSSNLTRIVKHIEQIHVENQRQERYFEAMIEHVSVGIMSLNPDGFVIHSNSSLKRLLGLKQFTHIRQLQRVDDRLVALLNSIGPNQEKSIRINANWGVVTLLVKATMFSSKNQQLKLISMQDIRKELDEKELDSWLKLIRVLTHEIMNSIAPVTSLSENLCSFYSRNGEPIGLKDVDDSLIQRTITGLRVIREQGEGLTRFVDNYRKLTRLPKPEPSQVVVKDLFEKSLLLFKSHAISQNINVSYVLDDENQTVFADENQISQVLINLLNNAAEALSETESGQIVLSCSKQSSGQVELAVTDNGPGVPADLIDEIFVPFFTTRANGSGIGLSVSRQILRLNNGTLRVKSIPHSETVFTLCLNG